MLWTTDSDDPRFGVSSDDEATSQNKAYFVLSDVERLKGFVRPMRRSYKHMKCGVVTTIATAVAETYAHNPEFYAATYCIGCRKLKPISEFVWVDDGTVVGT